MTEALQVTGCVVAAAAVSIAMLGPGRRLRAAALLGALAIALALLLGEGWDELASIRDRPAVLAALLAAATALVVVLGLLLRRRPLVLPLLLVAALPFRIPIDVSGDEVNLLVPLYVVIAAGTLAYAIDAFAAGGREPERPRLLPTALAVAIVLYEEFHVYRQIHTDGRQLPVDPDPNWYGYSVGRWDGETFVVVASNAGAARPPAWYLNLQANPHARIDVGGRSV